MARSFRDVVLKSFGSFKGPKVLLTPGRRGSWRPTFQDIERIAQEARVPIVFQSHGRAPGRPPYSAVSARGRPLPLRIYQLFADSKEASHCPKLVHELASQCDEGGQRTIHVGGFAFGLLICGENNVLTNEQRRHNRVRVRCHKGHKLFGGLRLIFNGGHTMMGEWGKLEERFRFLSSGKRWALYATNNARNDKKEPRGWGASTLRAYYDGSRIAASKGKEPGCPVPVCTVTSDDGRCRILTLDIPGGLLL